jgi:uncharacterized protein (DUF342 family)
MTDVKNIIEKAEALEEEATVHAEQLEGLRSEISILEQRNKEYESRIQELTSDNKLLVEENEQLESSNTELQSQVEKLTEEEAKVEVKVIEELQEIGVSPVSLTAEGSGVDYVAEFQSISDPVAKTKYYREHKEKILGGNL